MGNRDLKSASALKKKPGGAGGGQGQNVFGSHGNDLIKEHAGLNGKQGAAQGKESPMNNMLNTLLGGEEEQSTLSMTTKDAVDEVVDSLVEIQKQPELLNQLLNPQLDHADQTTQILEYLALEVLDVDVCEVLAQSSFDDLSSAIVISQEAEKACQMNGPELDAMGAFGPILWMLVDEALKMNLAPLQMAAKKDEEDAQDLDPDRMAASLNPVIATLRLEGS